MNPNGIRHVLLLDDETELLKTMSIIFEMAGYAVSKAENGFAALEILNAAKTNDDEISLVVTDLQMPGMTGIDFVREMRRKNHVQPVLALTGHGTKQMIIELMREGVNDYIEKPLNMQVLLSHVDDLIRSQGRKTELQQRSVREKIEAMKSEYEQRLLNSQEFEILGKLACGVAHDFNNILGVLTGYLDMLIEDLRVRPDAQFELYAQSMLNGVKTAMGIVNQLQSFRKGGTDTFQLLDLHEVVNEAVRLSRVLLQDVATVKNLFADGPLMIEGDRALLQNAMVNLLLNAKDAISGRGEITIQTVRDTVAAQDGAEAGIASVTVTDTGCGMTDDIRGKIFDLFFTTKGNCGNGIGLSSVLSIVEKHGGAVTVESQPGTGSSFTMVFPLAQTENG